MNKRVIRYKKPEWSNWVTMVVNEFEVEQKIRLLESLGYEVEK